MDHTYHFFKEKHKYKQLVIQVVSMLFEQIALYFFRNEKKEETGALYLFKEETHIK